jgi:hypothetical protein
MVQVACWSNRIIVCRFRLQRQHFDAFPHFAAPRRQQGQPAICATKEWVDLCVDVSTQKYQVWRTLDPMDGGLMSRKILSLLRISRTATLTYSSYLPPYGDLRHTEQIARAMLPAFGSRQNMH